MGRRAERARPDHAVGGVRAGSAGKAIGVGDPVEVAGIRDRAPIVVSVTTDELGRGVDRDVAPGPRPWSEPASRRVVDHQRQALGVGSALAQGLDVVHHIQPGIAESSRRRPARSSSSTCFSKLLGHVRIDEPDLDPAPGERVGEG